MPPEVNTARLPSLPLPEPIRGIEPGSFAEHTVAQRMPAIARRVPQENELTDAATGRMNALMEELPTGRVGQLADPFAPDETAWRREVQGVGDATWLEVPWFFAETYFYRRIVAAVGYFGRDGLGPDPFIYQKRRGLEVSATQIDRAFDELEHAIAGGWQEEEVVRLLKADLWGNQADLSLWPADDQNHPSHAQADADAHLLVDDAERTAGHLARCAPGFRLDVLVDNAGFELIGDLALADYALATGGAREVVLHVKIHPTFVSDATITDVQETVERLSATPAPGTRAAGERLSARLEDGTLRLIAHPFWTSPRPAWEMPDDVYAELGRSDLVVSKGDANYRRLLGDLHWPLSTPFSEIVAYFPAPLVALRTYKSELGSGLTDERISRLEMVDPTWLTNGRWGIVQAHGLTVRAD